MKKFYGFVKNKNKKTIIIFFFYIKYIFKLKLMIIKKKKIFVHDERNESNKGDFIFIKKKIQKSKLKLFFLIKIFKLNNYD